VRLCLKGWGCLVALSIPFILPSNSLCQEGEFSPQNSNNEERGNKPETEQELVIEETPAVVTEEAPPQLTFEESLDGAVDLALIGAYQQAQKELKNIILSFPPQAIVHYNLAVTWEMGEEGRYSGDLNRAVSEYLTCLQIDKNFLPARVNLGILYQKMGYLESAKEQYQRALKTDPQNKTALFNLAMIYYSQDNEEESLKNLKRLIKIYPDDTPAWRAIALISERSGDIAGAIVAWKEAFLRETNAKWAEYAKKRLKQIRGY